MTVSIQYPHQHQNYRPAALTAADIAAVAAALRVQLCSVAHRPKVSTAEVMRRARRLVVNSVTIDLVIDVGITLRDDAGEVVLGLTEHAESASQRVTVVLNGSLIDGDDALMRSTVAHELGHVIFDAPSWITSAQGSTSVRRQAYYFRRPEAGMARPAINWCEWRANTFMGAFLCPRDLLHQWLVKRAAALGVPMVGSSEPAGLPLVTTRGDRDRLDLLVFELADIFGLTPRFIETRLAKYRLIAER